MIEMIKEKEYELLSECSYFDKNGHLSTTPIKKVKMYALKFVDRDLVKEGSDEYNMLKSLCEKGYIAPPEGKLNIDSLDVRTAEILLIEYSRSFLDLSPFLPTK
jgi:hypothetical protein